MKVILYTTHCPKCEVLKKKLKAKNISYEEFDSIDEMLKLGIKTVPMLQTDLNLLDFSAAVQWINNLEE